MIKGIIFDLDGTLLDTSIDLFNAVNFSLMNNGLKRVTIEEVIENTGNGVRNLVKNCAKFIDEPFFDKIFHDFNEYYNVHSKDNTHPYINVIAVLKELKMKGIKLAVVSNKKNMFTIDIINHYFPGIFDFVTGERDGYKRKPYSDLIDLSLKSLGLEKNECLYVGDSLIDLKTAINSKLKYLICSYGFVKKEVLIENKAELIIDDFKEVLYFI